MKEDEKINKSEDTTKYGEFISSYFSWLTLSGQKERAKELNDMTRNDKK